jgi:hypothetical protein
MVNPQFSHRLDLAYQSFNGEKIRIFHGVWREEKLKKIKFG